MCLLETKSSVSLYDEQGSFLFVKNQNRYLCGENEHIQKLRQTKCKSTIRQARKGFEEPVAEVIEGFNGGGIHISGVANQPVQQ